MRDSRETLAAQEIDECVRSCRNYGVSLERALRMFRETWAAECEDEARTIREEAR